MSFLMRFLTLQYHLIITNNIANDDRVFLCLFKFEAPMRLRGSLIMTNRSPGGRKPARENKRGIHSYVGALKQIKILVSYSQACHLYRLNPNGRRHRHRTVENAAKQQVLYA